MVWAMWKHALFWQASNTEYSDINFTAVPGNDWGVHLTSLSFSHRLHIHQHTLPFVTLEHAQCSHNLHLTSELTAKFVTGWLLFSGIPSHRLYYKTDTCDSMKPGECRPGRWWNEQVNSDDLTMMKHVSGDVSQLLHHGLRLDTWCDHLLANFTDDWPHLKENRNYFLIMMNHVSRAESGTDWEMFNAWILLQDGTCYKQELPNWEFNSTAVIKTMNDMQISIQNRYWGEMWSPLSTKIGQFVFSCYTVTNYNPYYY